MTIAITALKEKIRRKELYIVSVIGVMILLLLGTGSGSLSINGTAITDYKLLAPILMIVVNAIACVLALAMSISTIPNEYERNTSHLIWIRGISQARYHGELAIANIVSGLLAEAILFGAMVVFMLSYDKGSEVWRLLPAFLIVGINMIIVSVLTSVCSIMFPKFVAGTIAIGIVLVGIFYSLLELFKDIIGGFGGNMLKYILKLVPNLHEIQTQAGNVLSGGNVDTHALWKGLLVAYILFVILLVWKRKEA